MADFKLDRFKKLPIRPATVWQGGVFSVPKLARDEDGNVVQPRMAVWADVETGLVSQPLFVEDGSPLQAALDALVEFGLDQETHRHRPSAIEVQDAELAAYLKGRLSGTGTRVECLASLPTIQAMLAELTQIVDDAEEAPGALSGRGVRLEHVRAFAEAAARFHEAKLWDELTAEDLVRVDAPKAPKGMGLFTVLGHDCQSFGVGFFDTLRQFELMLSGASPVEIMGSKGLWSMNFDALEALSISDIELWDTNNLPAAAADAYPSVCRFGPGMNVRRPSAKVLGFVTGLLLVLAETRAEDLDGERWTRTVRVDGRDVTYRLELVNVAVRDPLTRPDLLRAMEKHNAAIQRILDDRDFESPEEANAFINQHLSELDSIAPAPQSALDHAQEVVYEAWDASGRRRRNLARKALEICDDCADAYVILADEAARPAEAIDFYRQGVEAAERTLGAACFEENAGEFWGLIETRPYMRARFGLAQCLWADDRRAEAVEHYEALLRLNPNDNQGIRHILAACLLAMNDGERLTELFKRHENEVTAEWQYIRALWMFRQEGDSAEARRQATEALASNRHVPDFLAGRREIPSLLPGTYQLGAEDEAILCAAELGDEWYSTPGAIKWLDSIGKPRKGKVKRKPSGKRGR
ncbi:MAG: tetratricopeptide repeat protein [Phycisphaerales bacterium]|nr:tetratricopeptide repeat protein [Phycisphaerales bacterium]MCB9854765.1 tetratricopeptide repeat protein [Phycisphaerales bacterium]MCB9863763.1 tetratricopeptide repeat protein [Phycisphaerales bacterium]